MIISFTGIFDPINFVSTGAISAENEQNDLVWIN